MVGIAVWADGRDSDVASIAGISVDLASVNRARQIVLVEGTSDKAALDVLAERRGHALGPGGLHVVAMGGATSIGHFLELLGPHGRNVRLAGLCDAGQQGYLRYALERGGLGTCSSGAELEALGFHLCTADLEDELIRAVGSATVEQIIQAQGELQSFSRFQKQPAQRWRSTDQQLHRFMGTRSGRKARYARLLAQTLDLDRIPRPLDRVLSHT